MFAALSLTLELGSVLAGIGAVLVGITTFLNRKLQRINKQVNGGDATLHERLDLIESRISLLAEKIDRQQRGGDDAE